MIDLHRQLQHLVDAFFASVSFASGERPHYAGLYDLFTESGLLVRNNGPEPEICSVAEFIRPRQASVDAGELAEFSEVELAAKTEAFGRIAHRFSAYRKAGVMNGRPFEARGMISTQLVLTPGGWKISAMTWDDERPGLLLPEQFLSASATPARRVRAGSLGTSADRAFPAEHHPLGG